QSSYQLIGFLRCHLIDVLAQLVHALNFTQKAISHRRRPFSRLRLRYRDLSCLLYYRTARGFSRSSTTQCSPAAAELERHMIGERTAGVPLTRVSWTAAGVVLETAGTSVTVALRHWPMPIGRGGDHGTRRRFVCARCGSFRDALHWTAETGWGCLGKDCLNLAFGSRHELRWCPAIRRRARLLRKLARCAPKGLKARRLRAHI